MLLSHKASVNKPDDNGVSPLHISSISGDLETTKNY